MADIPVVVFGFNRPDKLARVFAALRGQCVWRLIVYVDGPRQQEDALAVEAVRELARGVRWTETELVFSEANQGVASLKDKMNAVLEKHSAAVFLEDDCIPSLGFYKFMSAALEHYQDCSQVFSIGGYQHLKPEFFDGYPYTLVSGARFIGWGWATWRDRWQRCLPFIEDYQNLYHGLADVPDLAGSDIGPAARQMASGAGLDNWDLRVALAALWLKQVHLVPVRGLIRTIGQDLSGMHPSLSNYARARLLHNQNVAPAAPAEIRWLEDISANCDYINVVREFASRSRAYSLRRWISRGKGALRRAAGQPMERVFGLNLTGSSSEALNKRALLVYISYPFSIPEDDPRFHRHVNIWHAREMVKVLNELGCRVDVIDYRDTSFQPERTYDLFIGHGGINFRQIANALGEKTPKIYFSTGAYWRFHNTQEQARLLDLQLRRSADLLPDRRIEHEEDGALQLSGGVIGIGNAFTRSTYRDWERVWMIPGTAKSDETFDWCPVDRASGSKHFLFFGSGGNVHKGLDLLLEAFAGMARQDLELWIMAPLDLPFHRLYRRELFEDRRVHALGYVLPRSPLYYRTLRQCTWVVLPSCSEGQAQSVIEAMNAGLIPLVSHASGVDVDGFGEWIEPVTIQVIQECIARCAELPAGEIMRRSALAREAARTVYSPDAFRRNFREALNAALAGMHAAGFSDGS